MPIICFNCNVVRTQYEEIKILLCDYNPPVLCLKETKLKPLDIKNYEIYRKDEDIEDGEHAHGGVEKGPILRGIANGYTPSSISN